MVVILQVVATVVVLSGVGAAAGLAFGEPGLGALVGLIGAIVLAVPAALLGERRSSALTLRGLFLFFRAGQGP